MKVLVVGGGGREHAIIRKLKESTLCYHVDSVRTETNFYSNINSVDCVEFDIVFCNITFYACRHFFINRIYRRCTTRAFIYDYGARIRTLYNRSNIQGNHKRVFYRNGTENFFSYLKEDGHQVFSRSSPHWRICRHGG